LIRKERAGNSQFGVIQRTRSSANSTASDCSFPTRLTGQSLLFEFILAEGGEHVDGEPSRGGRSVDVLAKGDKADLFAGQLIDDIQGVADITAKAIEADNDNSIPGTGKSDQIRELFAIVPATRCGLDKNAFASSSLKGIDLRLVILSYCAASAVADLHVSQNLSLHRQLRR
jgi:hypothetical protein